MFSFDQKRRIADAVQKILKETHDPELPTGEIQFHLHVHGAQPWSFADIRNNGVVLDPGIDPWNESVATAAERLRGGGSDGERCHSDDDGECSWEGCPQLRDGEPAATGRHCPLNNCHLEDSDG